jgi:hypothetical protein
MAGISAIILSLTQRFTGCPAGDLISRVSFIWLLEPPGLTPGGVARFASQAEAFSRSMTSISWRLLSGSADKKALYTNSVSTHYLLVHLLILGGAVSREAKTSMGAQRRIAEITEIY